MPGLRRRGRRLDLMYGRIMHGGLEPLGADAALVTDDSYRLSLAKRGAGGERLIESLRAQRLASLGDQLGLALAQRRPHPQADPPSQAFSRALEPRGPLRGVMMPWQSQCRTCGNQVAPLLNNIKKGQRGCKWCAGRAIDPAEAAAVMRAAGLEPLTTYPGAHAPWPCRCQRCHETVTPRYRAVQAGSGCRYCNDTAINPEAAVSLMREAGLEPLEQYPGSLRPWTCQCNKCGRTVQPCYSTIQRGSGGCRWCRNSGFKSAENAIVYLITHPGHSAAKIGITDADGSRLKKHSQQGWQILATVQVPGELALSVEKEILDWWRGELALPVHLGKPEMPHGGWTETVDSTEIDLAATIQRIKDLAAASHRPGSGPRASRAVRSAMGYAVLSGAGGPFPCRSGRRRGRPGSATA